jgi:hypothetical protein
MMNGEHGLPKVCDHPSLLAVLLHLPCTGHILN